MTHVAPHLHSIWVAFRKHVPPIRRTDRTNRFISHQDAPFFRASDKKARSIGRATVQLCSRAINQPRKSKHETPRQAHTIG